MTRTIHVEVDAFGRLHSLAPNASLPEGRALLSWEETETQETAQLSEPSFAEDWLRTEEDEAWAHLQQVK